MSKSARHALRTGFFLCASVFFAVLIANSGTIHAFLKGVEDFAQVGSLIAGMFFTSMFTTAPAIVVLGQLALDTPIWIVALFGAFGAVMGDYILFLLVREGVSRDIDYLLKQPGLKRFSKMFRTRLVRRVMPFIGALLLASPLPDELGLAMLGMSNLNKDRFLLVSFVMNFLGIVVIGLVARAVV